MPDRGMARRRLAGEAGGVLAGAFVACSPMGEATRPAAAPGAKRPVTLELATDWNAPPRKPVIELMRDEFVRQEPNVTVDLQFAPDSGSSGGSYSQRIIAQVAAGTPPDVIANWWFYQHTDALVDLTRDAPQAGWKKAEVVYHPQLQEVDGKLYMLSMNSTVGGWIYNKTLFGEAGLKEPDDTWTLDDVLAAAQQLTQREQQQWGLELKFGPEFGWLDPVWAAGAGATGPASAVMFDDRQRKSRLAEAGGPEAFEWYLDCVHKHRVAPTAQEMTEQRVGFTRGNVGLRPFGLYNSGGAARTIGSNFVWSVMPTPVYPSTRKRAYSVVQEGFVITRAAKERGGYETALRYVLSFYSDPVMRAVAESRSTLPIVRRWIDSQEYLAPPPLNLDVIVKLLTDRSVIVGTMQNWSPKRSAWDQAVNAALQPAYRGEAAPPAALRAAMDAGDRVLAAD
ncbi:MAG: ABC transporter substrate-binding protein [Chloroflexota bacterium]